MDNQDTRVEIGTLKLRLPGADADAGHRIASDVVVHLDRLLSRCAPRALGAVNLTVHMPPGASESQMIASIADAISNAVSDRSVGSQPSSQRGSSWR